MTFGSGCLVDALEHVYFERPVDAIAGCILDDRQHQQLVVASTPWVGRREAPLASVGRDVGCASDLRAILSFDTQCASQQAVIEWFGKHDTQRIARTVRGRRDTPRLERNDTLVGRADVIRATIR